MAHTVQIPKKVHKELETLADDIRRRIISVLDRLENEPRPVGSTKLTGQENRWRIRVGDYRIIYEIRDQELLILVVKIGHRREVYER